MNPGYPASYCPTASLSLSLSLSLSSPLTLACLVVQSFAKQLLAVADDIERTLKNVDLSDEPEGSPTRLLYEGVEITQGSLSKILNNNGVSAFGAVGDDFDPNIHEALFEAPNPSMPPATILEVMIPGYMIKSRVLRAAQVGVVKAP